ncbi:MAG TPA: hypothetical protein VGV61_13000 [Thermoanaerobaculia bacterium]|jgi:hypothetical protein|nr:hypothetical protein [Thermoanaerobaculia bacterium]
MSRKYGQRGYMEGDRERPSGGRPSPGATPREPPPPRHNLDRPRGRGLGAPSEQVFRCAVCGQAQDAPDAAALDRTCGKCGADLHTCTHCTHFDTAAPWECRRWQERRDSVVNAGPVAKKSKRNDCPLFAPKTTLEFGQEKPADPDDPRAAFDALFK